MDRNAKILAGVFGACLVYVLCSFGYPRLIEPLLTIDEHIAEAEEELEKLEAEDGEVHQAKLEYRDLLDRIGSFDELRVKNGIRQRLNELIARYKLEGAGTSPSRPQVDRKTRVTTMHVSVTAVGTLESAVGFLRDVAELPHLLRIGNASIYPVSSSRKRRSKKAERVNIRVPIEIKVLPQQRILDERLRNDDLKQPEALVRHEDRDYSTIWKGTPFTEFIPLKPLVVEAGADVNVQVGLRASLKGKARGGDGQYTYQWSPEEGLSDPTSPKAKLDAKEAYTRVYTLTVNDESGNSAEDSVTVTVKEKSKPKEEPKVAEAEPELEPSPPHIRWMDRKNLKLCMTMMHSEGDSRVQEVMVYDRKSKEIKYYPVQAEFDGGTLVRVHPRGGVVRRDDGGASAYFVYPIGAKLDEDIRAEDAGDYPVLQSLAFLVRDSELAAQAAEESDNDDEADVGDANPDAEETAPRDPAELKPEQPPAGEDSAAGAKAGPGAEEKPAPVGTSEQTSGTKPASGKSDEKAAGTKPGSTKENENTSGAEPTLPKPGAKADDGKPAAQKAGSKGGGEEPALGERGVKPTRGKGAPPKTKAKAERGKTKSRKAHQGRPSAKQRRNSAAAQKKEKLEERR